MVLLDGTITIVALPSIGADLGFAKQDLPWVLSAYAITVGGLLLLGGRAADLLGRRRVFMAGVLFFTAASLVCGLAWSPAGFGWDCGRHYEAPLVNTVPLINYPTIMRHGPLLDGEHCVLYGVEPGGLAQAARAALADKPRLRRIAAQAAAHVRRHHSWQARAEHVVVTVLGRRLDGSRVPPEAARDPS